MHAGCKICKKRARPREKTLPFSSDCLLAGLEKVVPQGPLSFLFFLERCYCDERRGAAVDADRIMQRLPKSFERHFHDVAVLKFDSGSEAEGVGSEKMYVDVAGSAVLVELEVMMLQVGERVCHVCFSAVDRL